MWEDKYRERVDKVRKKELKWLRSYLLCDAVLRTNWIALPALVGLVTFLVHTQVWILSNIFYFPHHLLNRTISCYIGVGQNIASKRRVHCANAV